MQDIKRMQNEEEILQLLFSQRKFYDDSENYSNLSWVFAVIMFLVSLINIIFNIPVLYSTLSIAVLTIIILVMEKLSMRCVKIGAATKKYIDFKLFGFNDNNFGFTKEEIKEFAINKRRKYPEEYIAQISNTGTDEIKGVKDWYVFEATGFRWKDIYTCQKQNIWWNGALSKKYVYLLISSSIFIILLFIGISLVVNPSARNLWIAVASNVGLFIKIFEDIKSGIKYYQAYHSAQVKTEIFDTKSELSEEDMKRLQSDIDKIRNIKFLVPDFLHRKNSIVLHDIYRSLFG